MENEEQRVVFSADGTNSLLTLVSSEDIVQKPPRKTGLYHFAILLPSRKDLGSFINHIRDKQTQIVGGSNHGVSEAIYLQDPEDNGIELYSDFPDNTWQRTGATVNMISEPINYEELMKLGEGTKWYKIPEGTILGHIHLHVNNLSETYRFYETIGFNKVADLAGSATFISTGGYHHHLGMNTWNGTGISAPPENATGLDFYTLRVASAQELNKIAESLKEQEYPINKEGSHIVTRDPAGNGIKLQA